MNNHVTCGICDKQYSSVSNLNKHVKLLHNLEPQTRKRCLVCPSCKGLYATYADLRDHLIITHKMDIYMEEKLFDSYTEFEEWKELKEKEMKCTYVKTTGKKSWKATEKFYYICHRSFTQKSYRYAPQDDRQKMEKSQGYAKTDITCPSTLDVTLQEEKLKAVLYYPHIGHTCSLAHINLTKTERKHIAGKIAQGVSFEKILDEIRDGLTDETSLGRINLLDRQDLRNITRDFSLKANVQLHQSDVVSVALWVKRLKSMEDEFPLFFYKAQGENESTVNNVYNDNDFVLMFMTSFQKNQLLKFGSNKICVDSTHGTTGYDFLLTTLLIVDEFGEGVPCAFLISNRVDTCVLTHFFQMIKEQTDDIKCNVFMSDDAPEFYNAWVNCMSIPVKQLLCTWHVDRNWRKNLNKITGGQDMKVKVYKSLRMLLQVTEETEFTEMLNFILSELLSCEETRTFGEYFKTYYVARCNLWAYCYRGGSGINTNMYLESMHRTLKHIYFQGKKNKRVDVCLHTLMKLVRDIMIKKLKRSIKGSNSYRMDLIKRSHEKSKNILVEAMCCTGDNIWSVKSENDKNVEYTVQKGTEECFQINKTCHLFCKSCQICIHEFTCSCLDFFIKGNICKHIHAVVKHFSKPSKYHVSNPQMNEQVQDEIIKNLVVQNDNMSEKKCNDKLRSKVDILYGLISKNDLTLESKEQLDKLLDKAITIAAKGSNVDLNQTSNEPSNKKIQNQPRFESTKRKRTSNNPMSKPSTSDIQEFIDECDNKVKSNDHLYTKNISIFKP